MIIDISKYNKADVLAALYNNAKTQGLGTLHYTPEDLQKEEAEELLKKDTYFDYLKGRVMKVDLSGNALNSWGYDRDNGQGSTQAAISRLEEIC